MEHPPTPDGTLRLAATIGVHARSDEQQGEGWWAVTDAGARVFVPAGAVEGWRTLRNGQRVHLELDADSAAPRVLRATPPYA